MLLSVLMLGSMANAATETSGGTGSSRRTALVRAVERARQSMVNIHSEKRARDKGLLGTSEKRNGMGSGTIIDERGYIVTNSHVVSEVDSLSVTLGDGSRFKARVVDQDLKHDLAIIKIETIKPVSVMPIGTSCDLMLAEDVVAIGNPFGYEDSVSRGIISHLSRDVEVNKEQAYEDLIQIDAAINPGNSGGPLLNADGEMIGINVAIRADAQKIGFAIPIDQVRRVIAQLMSIERRNSHYHGVRFTEFKSPAERKLIVEGTESSGPGTAAGLKAQDVIVKAGTTDVRDRVDFERALLDRSTGERIPLVIERGGSRIELALEIGTLPTERRPAATAVVRKEKPAVSGTVTSGLTDREWHILGMKLSPVGPGQISGNKYHGGLMVMDVRQNGPASVEGIKKGDILIGLHLWETVSHENVEYVITHPELTTFSPLKFWILRGQETLYGHLNVLQNVSR